MTLIRYVHALLCWRNVRQTIASFIVLVAALAGAVERIHLPDPKDGVINGKVAVMFWPASPPHSSDRPIGELLSPDNCHVVLEPWTNLAEELTNPCGIWFQPPEGRYRVWLEKGESLTSTTGSLNYAASPFTGRGQGVVMAVVPGGRVTLSAEITVPPNAELRLINFDSCCSGTNFVHPFDRRALPTAPTLRSGLLVPVGRVFAGIFDRKTNEALAIAKLVYVAAGKVVSVSPRAPANGADVFVSLMRPDVRKTRDVDTIRLTLDGVPPQMLFDGADRVYAAWYSVAGNVAHLAVESKTLRFAPRELKLERGHVVTVRDELRRLPSVAVSLLAPHGALAKYEPRVEVREPSHNDSLRSMAVAAGTELRLDALPAEPLDILLTIGPWLFRKSVDLTRGIDERLVFDLHPIVVSGTVYYGRAPSPNAEVGFETGHGWERTKADTNGQYEATLWTPDDAYLAEVQIANRDGPPFEEAFVQIRDSRTLDFHVPATRYRVRVVDAQSGEPVRGASVSAANIWLHPSGEEATLMQRAAANDEGVAMLAPLRRGKLTVRARAAGYFDSDAVDGGTIANEESEGELEVKLRPIGEAVPMRLRSADGSPVAGAEVWAVAATNGTRPPLWRGASDSDGIVEVPRSVDGAMLLIRSRATASAVRSFHAANEQHDVVLQSAAVPVRIRVGSPDTRVAVWIDGARIVGPAVTFLTWSSEVSNGSGIWTAENLPRQPLRLLAWRHIPEPEIVAGLRDTASATISYPWPPAITIQPLE
jgi:hypothetical protein